MTESSPADALDRHVAELRACRRCPRVLAPPVAADPVMSPSILLVGQAPGPRERETNRLFAYTAGTRLFSWFASVGASEEEFRERVWMSATIRCFPGRQPAGGDRAPAPDEIAACAPYLEREIELLRPELVLAIGTLAIGRFLPTSSLSERVGQMFRGRMAGHQFDVLPLPHPSGRSTWINQPQNAHLLDTALRLLAESAVWRRTFAVRPASEDPGEDSI